MVGEADSADRSMLQFSQDDVESRTDGVLVKMEEWRERRTRFRVSMAIMGRCFALDVWRESEGNQAAGLIGAAFRRHVRWTEADFVGNCILLRACVKTLTGSVEGGEEKVEEWKRELREFLQETDDSNFGRKYHATLALRNLVDGPMDESSKRLFSSERWLF